MGVRDIEEGRRGDIGIDMMQDIGKENKHQRE